MDRRRLLKAGAQLSLMGAGWLGASAFISEQQAPSEWAPHRVESSDPLWPMLNGATLSYDAEKGVLKANFTDTIRSYHGKAFTIGGFYMPLDARRAANHFLLTRRNSSCPFCPGNEPTEAVEIFADRPVPFTKEPLTASGRFELVAESADGLFYRLRQAQVRLA
jgi:hypothetical protein